MPQLFNVAGPVRPTFDQTKATAEDFGAGVGKGLQAAAAEVKRFEKEEELKERRANADTVNQANLDTQGEWDNELLVAQKNAAVDGAGLTDDLMERFDAQTADVLANSDNDDVRNGHTQGRKRIRNKLFSSASNSEAKKRGAHASLKWTENGEKHAIALRQTPTPQQFDTTMTFRRAELDNLPVSDTLKAEWWAEEENKLRYNMYSGALDLAKDEDDVANVLAVRKGLNAASFGRLDREGKSRVLSIKGDIAEGERKQRGFIRDANASMRIGAQRLIDRGLPAEEMDEMRKAVTLANDPVTTEKFANLVTLAKLTPKWRAMGPSTLKQVVAQLDAEANAGGATDLEEKKYTAALAIFNTAQLKANKTQAEIDTSATDLLGKLKARLAAGQDLSQDLDMAMLGEVLQSTSPKLRTAIEEAISVNETGRAVMVGSSADRQQIIKDLLEEAKTTDAGQLKLDAALAIHRNIEKGVNTNYMDVARDVTPKKVTTLDLNDPSTISKRGEESRAYAAKYNQPANRFHTSAEIAAIGDKLKDMDSAKQLGFIQSYIGALGKEQAIIALSELSSSNVAVAYVGAGMLNGLSLTTGNNILAGQKRINDLGKSIIGDRIDSGISTAAVETNIREAMIGIMNQQVNTNAKSSVMSATLSLIASGNGTDTKTVKQYLSMALGGNENGTLGGIQKFNGKEFVAPQGVSSDQISTVFEYYPNSVIGLSVDGYPPVANNGTKVSANMIANEGNLESIGAGVYVVRMPDKLLLQSGGGGTYRIQIDAGKISSAYPDERNIFQKFISPIL